MAVKIIAAPQALYNPSDSELTIKSGNIQSNDLTFKLDGTNLTPTGKTTTEVLATYGCKNTVTYTYFDSY